MTSKGVEPIQRLFNRWVKHRYPDKTFCANCVNDGYGGRKSDKYNYEYDGVEINYLRRLTWCDGINDCDYFVDYLIYVDGECVANVVKE